MDLLPESLRARATALNGRDCDDGAGPVLYWMRTAVRAHDNPALNAAVELANSLGVPMLIWHALSERYPFASDRHHRFILEGARDVQRECAERGIPYVFHLERPGQRGDFLRRLAGRAAAIVTESFPWTPIRRWTRAVAKAAPVGMIGVDAACLVPMPQVPANARERAFGFRRKTADLRAAALAASEYDPVLQIEGALPELPVAPLDLQGIDLGALIARCEIDHTVGPVPHTPGGSRAGYARWHAFRDGALRSYDARRNDPLQDGVSRMSPYLHYGHVSPMRIAREAHDLGGRGADKFLDELLVWRELAWAWCFHNRDHDSLDALPEWARETLQAHAQDQRPAIFDAERLARGRTGDALWDAAQRSLLIHGELHNNLRMTWGKMIPQWTPDPETALARLIDLNHRYALDGRDPNSYGGLLWCLGAFDRPFDPPRAVLGRVRPRDTGTHAKRLDVAAYAARVNQPAHAAPPRVAVVGAGMAGLIAGRTLADHGWPVTLFDKGRVPGGRLATRRSRDHRNLRFDHGVPAFRVEDPRFRRLLDAWCEAGLVTTLPDPAGNLFTAVDGAAAIGAHLAADLDVHAGVRIAALERAATAPDASDSAGTVQTEAPSGAQTRTTRPDAGPCWWLTDADGSRHGPFDALVLALPPAQAAALLRDSAVEGLAEKLAPQLASRPMQPVWTAMVHRPDVDVRNLAFMTAPPRDAAAGSGDSVASARSAASTTTAPEASALPDHGPIALMVNEAARDDGRRRGCFTFHASAQFSLEQLEAAPESVARLLGPAIGALLGVSVDVDDPAQLAAIRCHRWRYAQPGPDGLRDLPPVAAWHGEHALVLCGDWIAPSGCCGVERAYLSGAAAAGRLLGSRLRGPERADEPPGAPQADLFDGGA